MIRPLLDVRASDAGVVGGKAASLGELLAAGRRVPDGFVIAADGDVGAEAVLAACRALGPGPFAVRSSAIGEDGTDQSFAGMFSTELDVPVDEVPAAVERVIASAGADRVAAYASQTDRRIGVIVQAMVRAAAAGVALTADPVSGERSTCVVSAVRGLGDRLVSGQALGDAWSVRGRSATAGRQPERAISARQARQIADEARAIADARGVPQDVEWAIDADDELWVLQARPMTALPPEVSWDPPVPGAYTRAIRLGEWIGEPVTPLFESWLLSTLEERLHDRLREWIGQVAPRPYHVVVNGWYFYSINFLSARALGRTMPHLLSRLVRTPRRVVGLVPPLLHHSIPVYERDWREELLPRYRAAVAEAEAQVESLAPAELPALIDALAERAGDYFGSVAAFVGAAYKAEIPLARFYARHLAPSVGGSHLTLLSGLAPPLDPGAHAVANLDWYAEPIPTAAPSRDGSGHERLADARRAAEDAAEAALGASPRRLRSFRQLLERAQRMVPLREEHVRELTLAWPTMRRAVLRIGEALVERGLLERSDDVFFLRRDELEASLAGEGQVTAAVTAERRAERERNARLTPPMLIGRINPLLRKAWEGAPGVVGGVRSERALVTGTPASAGRVSGLVRVVRGPNDFGSLRDGEVLVAPLTAPAWTPLFTRAAAVVTDVGSVASHASIIAREYGIPAVVGCGDATARLRDGMCVLVDGATGNVEPAPVSDG